MADRYENVRYKTRRVNVHHMTDVIEQILHLFDIVNYHGGVESVFSLARYIRQGGKL